MRYAVTLAFVVAAVAPALVIAAATAPAAQAANGWLAAGALATPRADHSATLLPDGDVLVAGGRGSEPLTAALASAELYDPASGRWTVVGPMAVARSGHTATLLTAPGCGPNCGKVLVVGGSVTQDPVAPGVEVAASAELYDPATRTWAPTGPLNVARTLHTASRLQGAPCEGAGPPGWCGKVLVTGGQPTAPATELATAELFDPASGRWTAAATLATPRRGHTATALRDGTVLAVGGRNDSSTDPAIKPIVFAAERFDPASGAWSAAGSTVIGRALHTASVLGDGRVLVAGGLDSFNSPRRSSELYDPAAPAATAWLPSPSMADGRGSHTATLLDPPSGSGPGAGDLLVVGGGGQDLDRATTERHDPSTPRWAPDAALATSRQRHTATLLTEPGCEPSCGRVLVVGGLRQTSTFVDSAELYGPPPPAPPPGAPARPATAVTDLAARALSARRISLTFSAPSPSGEAARPATRYLVKQSLAPITAANFTGARPLCGGTCSFAVGQAGDQVTLAVGELVPDRLYHYALQPLDGAASPGTLSNVAQARTSKDAVKPGRPHGLSARPRGVGRVRLRFQAPASDGAEGPPVETYVVKQATRPIRGARGFRRARSLCGAGGCRFGPDRVGTPLTLTVRRLCPGRRYHYAIAAKDEGGNLSGMARFRAVRAPGARGRGC